MPEYKLEELGKTFECLSDSYPEFCVWEKRTSYFQVKVQLRL